MSNGSEIVQIIILTLRVAGLSTLAACLVSIPLGYVVGTCGFRGRDSCLTLLNTLMAFPTVLIGLITFILLSRQGPFGQTGLLFTPTAIAIGDFLLATPLMSGLIATSLKDMDRRVKETAVTLGGSQWRILYAVLREERSSVAAAIVAGFGRVISEVGSAMILGGNIRGHTRTLTTAIALDTRQGNIEGAVALGAILLALALTFNGAFLYLHGRMRG